MPKSKTKSEAKTAWDKALAEVAEFSTPFLIGGMALLAIGGYYFFDKYIASNILKIEVSGPRTGKMEGDCGEAKRSDNEFTVPSGCTLTFGPK